MSAVNGTRIFRPGVPQASIDIACDGDHALLSKRYLEADPPVLNRAHLWVGYAARTENDRSQSQPQQIVSWVQLVTEGATA